MYKLSLLENYLMGMGASFSSVSITVAREWKQKWKWNENGMTNKVITKHQGRFQASMKLAEMEDRDLRTFRT